MSFATRILDDCLTVEAFAVFFFSVQAGMPAESSRIPTTGAQTTTTPDRYRGCLLALAAGDALGTTLEFERLGRLSHSRTWPAAAHST